MLVPTGHICWLAALGVFGSVLVVAFFWLPSCHSPWPKYPTIQCLQQQGECSLSEPRINIVAFLSAHKQMTDVFYSDFLMDPKRDHRTQS